MRPTLLVATLVSFSFSLGVGPSGRAEKILNPPSLNWRRFSKVQTPLDPAEALIEPIHAMIQPSELHLQLPNVILDGRHPQLQIADVLANGVHRSANSPKVFQN
jgi:hypothetical protein